MNMKIRLLMGLLVFSGVLHSQEDPFVTKVVRVHGDAVRLRELACSGSGVSNCEASEPLRAIVVNGHSTAVTKVEQTIRELDALSPSSSSTISNKNVELTTYVIGGSTQPFVGAKEVSGETLAPVIKQLRAVFPYSHYQLLSTMVMRSALNGKAESSGLMGVQLNPDFARPSMYKISYDSAQLSGASPDTMHLASFRFSMKLPYVNTPLNTVTTKSGSIPYANTSWSMMDLGLQTDVDLREGQKVVVGKTNVSDSDSCIFLVLVARLVP